MSQTTRQANLPSKDTAKPHRQRSQGLIPPKYLLEVLLEHPDFSGFTERGDDYRDWSEKNPGLSLSLKGWKDFRTGKGGALFELAKELGLLDQARERAGLPEFRQTKKSPDRMFPPYDPNEDTLTGDLFDQPAQNSSDTADFARDLWQQPEDKSARQKVQEYLDSRSIPRESYSDLLDTHIRCVVNRGNHFLIMAMLTPEQANQAAAGSVPQSIQKIHRVHLSEADRPKRQLGSPADKVGRVSYLPPLSANGESLQYLVCEGLEDALSIRSRYRDHHFLVCQSKGNLKHIPAFLPEDAEVLVISDHDGHEDQNQNGEFESAKLRRDLLSRGYICRALMPPEPKTDANNALQTNKLEQWLANLMEVPKELISQDSQFDVEAVVGDLLPKLPRGILPEGLEDYLELAAESLDLNYESSFCELLCNVAFAIGGHKKISIKHNWQEKALLWLASIGASGLGKTPLNRICGGEQLDEQQRNWHHQHKLELEQWDNQQAPRPPKPIRKRWVATALTMERLCALHEENPAGIGLLSDEIVGVLDGLNQYKGRGNDRQKLLILWNGHSFDNPTSDDDRYISSVFVPVSGGIQEGLLRSIINDKNTTDGLASRFLFSHLIPSRDIASIERQQEIDELLQTSEGKQMLISLFSKLVGIRDKESVVLMGQDAKNHLQLFEHRLKEDARSGSEQAFAAYAKLRTYIYRIALVLHYLTEKYPDDTELSEQTALNTLTVMRFFVASMKRAYQTVALNKTEENARKVLEKVRRSGGKASQRAIKQDLRRSIGDQFEPILKVLVETGELTKTKKGRTFEYSIS